MPIQTHPYSHGVVLGFLLLLIPLATAQTPPPDPPPYEFSPGMATVVVVLIIIFFTVGFISVYIRHFVVCLGIELGRNRGGGFEGWLRRERLPQGLDPAVVNAFPTFIYSDVKMHRIGKSSLECAICISEFTDHEILRMLPTCSHVFHPNCIGPWFELHVTCPVCRANLEVHVDDTSVHSVGQQLEQQSSADNEPEPSDHHHHNNNNNNRDVIVRVGASPESNVMVKSPVVVQDKKGVGVHMGKLPRSHSTGHSLVEDCERYTLRLPEEVRNKLVNVNLTGLPAAIISPRVGFRSTGLGCAGIVPGSKPDRWRFSASPPFISRPGSPRPDGPTGNDIDNGNSVGGRRGPRNLFKTFKSPLNPTVRTDDIGERSTNKLWVNRTTQDLDFEGQWHHDP